mmetsp:Transcript_26312/g.42617  ORF Transcript_26312/g.42617 Transcript_26312/m.42617 type:complete len:221 (-) Transcript_26312:2438-3100(-)
MQVMRCALQNLCAHSSMEHIVPSTPYFIQSGVFGPSLQGGALPPRPYTEQRSLNLLIVLLFQLENRSILDFCHCTSKEALDNICRYIMNLFPSLDPPEEPLNNRRSVASPQPVKYPPHLNTVVVDINMPESRIAVTDPSCLFIFDSHTNLLLGFVKAVSTDHSATSFLLHDLELVFQLVVFLASSTNEPRHRSFCINPATYKCLIKILSYQTGFAKGTSV